jgi:serine/threonine-protein kinase
MDALGTGSMGTVYKAQSKNDNRWYAVKVLPRRSMWNVRIARRKVREFEQCQHPAVVPFVDVGTSGGMHYLSWPLVEGESLDKIVEREGKLSPAMAAMYVLQTCEGLEVCHQHGLFHGLLKPSNLMIGTDGQLRILDFGIGSLLAETEGESLVDTMSTANSVSSGLDCASPESIMDPTNLTPIGDQYSLGCVLYYCMTGKYPFPDGTAVEKMMAHQTKQPTPIRELNPEIPEELATIVERLMHKTPEERYANVREVIEALRRWAAPMPQASRQVPRLSATAEARTPRATTPSVTADTPRPNSKASPSLSRTVAVPAPLPSRHSLQPPPIAQPAPLPSAPEFAAPAPPRFAGQPEDAKRRSWDENLGGGAKIAIALIVCVTVYLIMRLFM